MLSGKSVGILFSTLPEQSTVTPSEVSVQLHTLGHADATPTSNTTTTIAVQLLWRLVPFYEGVFHLNQSVSYLSDHSC